MLKAYSEATILGIKIFKSIYCMVRNQYRFPRSKRRRLRKKWAKNEQNFLTNPDPNIYYNRQQGTITGHPTTIAKLRKSCMRQK